jgi:hypothetical protein
MDGVDDLGVVDPLQVDAGDTEVAVAELALDDLQRHAFARQLDGVRVAELVRREAAANAGRDRGVAKLVSGGTGPLAPTRRSVQDAQQWPDEQLGPQLEPRLELGPAPRVHARLAATSALAATQEQRAAALIEIGLGQGQRLVDAQPGTPQDHDQAAQPDAGGGCHRLSA